MVEMESGMADGSVSGKLPPQVVCKGTLSKGLWNSGDKVTV